MWYRPVCETQAASRREKKRRRMRDDDAGGGRVREKWAEFGRGGNGTGMNKMDETKRVARAMAKS